MVDSCGCSYCAECLNCRTSVYGSAVCVYNLTAFDEAFDGPFKYQADSQSAWTRVPNTTPVTVSLSRTFFTFRLELNSVD